MKNLCKQIGIIAFIAIIGILFSSCVDENEGGNNSNICRLTITGLDTFNDKYVLVEDRSNYFFYGYQSYSDGNYILPKVIDGSVVVNLWYTWGDPPLQYEGTGTSIISIKIYNTHIHTWTSLFSVMGTSAYAYTASGDSNVLVTLSNGKGTMDASTITFYY